MTLSILWFILIAVLWTGYIFLEGFDFGVGMSLPFVAKSDQERTQAVRTIGPHWDGNEVWLLTAGGATFAAMPEWYATMFSGMYLALFVILVLLILRIASLEWRSKLESESWRSRWDVFHTVSAFGVPLLFGVAFANLVKGMKIEVVDRATQRVVSPEAVDSSLATASHQLTGGFFSLLTPFTILGGLVLVTICFTHGLQFLSLKTEGEVRERANALAAPVSILNVVLVAAYAIWGQFAFSNQVLSWVPLVIAAVAWIVVAAFSQPALRKEGAAFIASGIGIVGCVAWIFLCMFPDVMKSSIDPAYSLTIEQASASQPTLTLMSIVALCLVPVVLAYTIWSYWVFRHRVGPDDVTTDTGLLKDKIRLDKNFLVG